MGAAAAVGQSLYWSVVLWRAHRELKGTPSIREGLAADAPAGGWPLVTVVVPAHNEELHAPICARSLLAQDYPSLEVIFVLDRCTDGTLAALEPIAREDPRLVLVQNDSCPVDWAGKCNAAAVGAKRARGQMLLFTDADTHFDKSLVRAAVGVATSRGLALTSILSTLTTGRWFEVIAQPVAVLALMQQYPTGRANDRDNPRAFANGQFMLFARDAYEGIGGHAAVKDDLLEDIAFARAVAHRLKRPLGLCLADGMLVVSMYESLASFMEGWKRIFIESCLRQPARLRRKAVEASFVGLVLPLLAGVGVITALVYGGSVPQVLRMVMVAAAIVGAATQVLTLAYLYHRARSPILGAALHSAGSLVVALTLLRGASDLIARKPVRWGGRTYILEPR